MPIFLQFLRVVICSIASAVFSLFLWLLAGPESGGGTSQWQTLGTILAIFQVVALLAGLALAAGGRTRLACSIAASPPLLILAGSIVFQTAFIPFMYR